MAPRQTARRLLVAAPALAIAALAVTACSPPNEKPADPDAPYTLPTYSEEPKATTSEAAPHGGTSASETTAEETPAEGAPAEGGQPGQSPAPAPAGAPAAPPAQPAP